MQGAPVGDAFGIDRQFKPGGDSRSQIAVDLTQGRARRSRCSTSLNPRLCKGFLCVQISRRAISTIGLWAISETDARDDRGDRFRDLTTRRFPHSATERAPPALGSEENRLGDNGEA